MRREGICVKCGQKKIIQDHHSKGYEQPYEDFVEPYCRSCDLKAHNKARAEGRCKLNHKEASKKSLSSCMRRSRKTISFKETILPNIRLIEMLEVKSNGNLSYSSYFLSSNGYKIMEICD